MTVYSRQKFELGIASELSSRRLLMGLSQTALSEELGLDQATVSKIEGGNRQLNPYLLMRWLEVLGLTPEDSGSLLARVWKSTAAAPESLWTRNE